MNRGTLWKNTQLQQVAIWIFTTIILSMMIWYFGHKQFGGFDHSALIDTAWRFFIHQRPYYDFILTTPLAFNYGAWLAFSLWGVKWSSLVLINVAFSIIIFLLHTISLKKLTSPYLAIAIAFSCQVMAMVVTSYWWYNSISIITACLFVTIAICYFVEPITLSDRVILIIAVFLLFLMKPNIAGPLILLLVGILLLFNARRVELFLLFGLSVLLVLGLLSVLHNNPIDVLKSYTSIIQSRGLPSINLFFQDKQGEELITIPLIFFGLVPLFGVVANLNIPLLFKTKKEFIVPFIATLSICLVGIMVGFLGMVTNSDSNLVAGLSLIFLCPILFVLTLLKFDLISTNTASPAFIMGIVGFLSSFVGIFVRTFYPDILNSLKYFSGFVPLVIGWHVVLIFDRYVKKFLNSPLLLVFWKKGITFIIALSIITNTIIAAWVGYSRLRVLYIGPGTFFSEESLVKVPDSYFFDNFYVSDRLRGVITEIEAALDKYQISTSDGKQSVFFGPRISFGYAAFQIPSPTEMPAWFAPGVVYPSNLEGQISQNFKNHEFTLCIFLKNGMDPDLTFIPSEIYAELTEKYIREDMQNIIVYKRR